MFKIKLLLLKITLLSILFIGCNSRNKKPNVIFILVDDLGWNDLGYTGSTFYESPNIDKFSNESFEFLSAYSASPVCSPTRAGLLTGKYGFKTNVLDVGDKLDENEISIQEKIDMVFNDTYSFGVIGKWHLSGTPTIASDVPFLLTSFPETINGTRIPPS